MNVQSLPRNIYNKSKSLRINQITLSFSGGSDTGYLDVEVGTPPSSRPSYDVLNELCWEIKSWAWKVYEYGGAGEGDKYGDTITYDLESNEVRTEQWYQVVETEHGETTKLQVKEE